MTRFRTCKNGEFKRRSSTRICRSIIKRVGQSESRTFSAQQITILKIITGVLSPTSGEVEIDGRISALLEPGAGFNMEYTGIENVYLNGMMMGFSREEMDARLDDI